MDRNKQNNNKNVIIGGIYYFTLSSYGNSHNHTHVTEVGKWVILCKGTVDSFLLLNTV